MQRSLRLSLSLTSAAALALASSMIQRVVAHEDVSAEHLSVMWIIFIDATSQIFNCIL